MNGLLTTRSRNLRRFGLWQLALIQAGLFSSFALANEVEFTYDERLLPVTRTYLNLQMCSDTAFEFEQDEPLATRYREAAHGLSEVSGQVGWDSYEFASSLQIAMEELSLLELRENESRESYRRRFFSGKPCEKAMKQAQNYLEKGLPAPKPSGQ